MKNFEWCVYTYNHRKAFLYVAKRLIKDEKLLEKILERGKKHDLDKLFLYQFLSWDDCIAYHVTHQPHHLEYKKEKTYEDYVETVIDYECSPYTKPDKPLNAFDFTNKLVKKGEIEETDAKILFEIMHDFKIDISYDVTKEQQCIDFLNSLDVVTEEMILLEVIEYVRTNPEDEINYMKAKIKKQV